MQTIVDPLISVVIPTYNRCGTLIRAVESVREQSWARWELIVVDDGSTDETPQRMTVYANDERIHYLRIDNQGAPHARNVGMAAAQGEYISLLDSDDVYEPERLAEQLRALQASEALLSISSRKLIDEFNEVKLDPELNELLTTEAALSGRVALSTSLFLMHRRVYEQVQFDELLASGQDFDFVLRVLKVAPVLMVGSHLTVIYKTAAFNRISTNFKAVTAGRLRLLEKARSGAYELAPAALQRLESDLSFAVGVYAFLDNQDKLAQAHLRGCLRSGESPLPRRLLATSIFCATYVPFAHFFTTRVLLALWRRNSGLLTRLFLRFAR